MSSEASPTLSGLFRYFFRLAWVGFGGPLAHISMMQQDVVERMRWLSREEFTEMLGITNMLPGPNSTEMAIHIGYVKGGRRGAVVSGLAFTVPGFLIMLALSWIYFEWGTLPSISGFFYGINPAVLAVIALTAARLGRASVKDLASLALLLLVFLAVLLTDISEALVLLAAGVAGIILYAPKGVGRPLPMVLLAPQMASLYMASATPAGGLELFLLFLKAGALLFGTGLVIIPLIATDVVEVYGWMDYKKFFDGVTLGQITPGPVVKTAAFVGYSVAGIWGAGIATLGVFLPPFTIVTLLAPLLRKMKGNHTLQAFLRGVRPAAVGAILAASVSLGQTALIDPWTAAIAALSLVALARFGLPIPLVVVASGLAGITISTLL